MEDKEDIDLFVALNSDDAADTFIVLNMLDILLAWQEQAAKLEAGEITKADYDQWRYTYPHPKD